MQDISVNTQSSAAANGMGSSKVKDGRVLGGLEAFAQMLSDKLGDGATATATSKLDKEKELEALLARLREKLSQDDDLSEADKQKILAMLMANPIKSDLIPVSASLNTDLTKQIALDAAETQDAGPLSEQDLKTIAEALSKISPQAGTQTAETPVQTPAMSATERKELIAKLRNAIANMDTKDQDMIKLLNWLEQTGNDVMPAPAPAAENNAVPSQDPAKPADLANLTSVSMAGLLDLRKTIGIQDNGAEAAPPAAEAAHISTADSKKTLDGATPKAADTAELTKAQKKTDYLRTRYAQDDTAPRNLPADTKDAKQATPQGETKIPAGLASKIDLSNLPVQLWTKGDAALETTNGLDTLVQNVNVVDSASGTAKPSAAENTFAAGRSLPAQNLQMVALQVQRNLAAKVDTFTVQLNPVELGRLDIKMRFEKDGLKLHMTADNADTLKMLQKDTQQLERLLQQSGIQADTGSMTFDLRQGAQDRAFGQNEHQALPYAGENNRAKDDITIEMPVAAEQYIRSDRVNITI